MDRVLQGVFSYDITFLHLISEESGIIKTDLALMKQQDKYETTSCLLVATFLGFFTSALLWAAGVLQGKIVVIFLLFTIASGIANELYRR